MVVSDGAHPDAQGNNTRHLNTSDFSWLFLCFVFVSLLLVCPFWFFLSLNASIFLLSLYPPLCLLGVLSIYVLHPQTDVCPLRDSPQEDVICPTLKSDIMLTVHFAAQLTDNTLCPGSAEQFISCLTNTYPPYSLGTLNLCDASITCPIMDADMRRVPASINTPDACDCYDARALLLPQTLS